MIPFAGREGLNLSSAFYLGVRGYIYHDSIRRNRRVKFIMIISFLPGGKGLNFAGREGLNLSSAFYLGVRG